MRVEVCDGVSLTNPIGDGKDYRGGAILDVSEGKAAAWMKLGWVKEITPTPLAEQIPDEGAPMDRSLYGTSYPRRRHR